MFLTSSNAKFPTQCLTVQYARMSLQLSYCSPNRTLCVKFIKSLNTEVHSHRVHQLKGWEISRDAAVESRRLQAAYHWFNLRGWCHRAYKVRASISSNEMWSGPVVYYMDVQIVKRNRRVTLKFQAPEG